MRACAIPTSEHADFETGSCSCKLACSSFQKEIFMQASPLDRTSDVWRPLQQSFVRGEQLAGAIIVAVGNMIDMMEGRGVFAEDDVNSVTITILNGIVRRAGELASLAKGTDDFAQFAGSVVQATRRLDANVGVPLRSYESPHPSGLQLAELAHVGTRTRSSMQ